MRRRRRRRIYYNRLSSSHCWSREPMTPVPMMNYDVMSPMGDDDHVDVGDYSRQLDQLATANQEALQELHIEERKE